MNSATQKAMLNFYSANQSPVDDLGNAIGVPGLWYVCLFDNESALQATIKNGIGAVGLNQMMPATLDTLNVTPAQFQYGGVAYQCAVMKRFFAPVAGKVKRAGDLYLFNFWPAAIIDNYPADKPIGVKNGTGTLAGLSQAQVYAQNASLDYNHDGIITRRDFWEGFEKKYDTILDSATPAGGYTLHDIWIDFKTNWFTWSIIAMVVMIALWYIYKNTGNEINNI